MFRVALWAGGRRGWVPNEWEAGFLLLVPAGSRRSGKLGWRQREKRGERGICAVVERRERGPDGRRRPLSAT